MLKNAIRYLYRSLPFKSVIFKIVRRIYTPDFYRHLHFNGWFEVKVDRKSKFLMKHYGFELENEIFWKGLFGWESTSLKIWTVLSKKSSVIFDIGANTGVYGLISACVNPSSKVFAFEPVHRVFEKLLTNIEKNNYKIRAFEVAVSNHDGDAVIYDRPTEHIYSVTVNQAPEDKNIQVVPTTIKTITLSSFIKQQNLKGIDLIKLDVETHEPEVLEGFHELSTLRPVFLIEILLPEVAERIGTMMTDYRWFKVAEQQGRLVDIGAQVKFIQDNDDYNYLAVPHEKIDATLMHIKSFI